ncbi:MAG TPA: SCO family protein [Haliangium sp.]|nr:SCO family protein [Haliangium sp.]
MKSRIIRWSLYALCFVAPIGLVLAGESSRPPAAPERQFAIPKAMGPEYFPNVVLRTHEDREVRFYDDLIKGKVVLINFMYARCEGICPGNTANLRKVQRLLGDLVGREVFMYSITLKPEEDTPEVLATYAAAHGVGPGWQFLTGTPEDVELLRQTLGFTDPDPILDQDKSTHVGVVLYGSEPHQQWAACPGLAEPAVLAEQVLWMVPDNAHPALPERAVRVYEDKRVQEPTASSGPTASTAPTASNQGQRP